jgi:hypothetical protein
MRLSVVVPATNRPVTLERCLAAIDAAGPDELVVVDEADRPGPAAARNEGVERATGEIVVFVDADVLIHADALERIRSRFAERPELVAVFGSYDDLVATEGDVAAFRNLLHHTVHQRSAGDVGTFWAGLGAVRRDAFAEVGGFDAVRYPRPSIEDIELGGRLAAHGPITLDGRILGTHLKEWTLGTMITTDFSQRGIPWVELIHEQGSVPATLNLGGRERASAVAALAAAYGLLTRRPLLTSAALATGVALNRDLFATIARRRGPRGAAVSVPLHVIHQLTAGAAIPFGLLRARARGA